MLENVPGTEIWVGNVVWGSLCFSTFVTEAEFCGAALWIVFCFNTEAPERDEYT